MAIQNYVFDGAVLAAAAASKATRGRAHQARDYRRGPGQYDRGGRVRLRLPGARAAPGRRKCLISARTIAPGETYFARSSSIKGSTPGGTVQALGAGLTFKYTAKDIING
jgi:hypothetical protein